MTGTETAKALLEGLARERQLREELLEIKWKNDNLIEKRLEEIAEALKLIEIVV
jgi:hypothetical protein